MQNFLPPKKQFSTKKKDFSASSFLWCKNEQLMFVAVDDDDHHQKINFGASTSYISLSCFLAFFIFLCLLI
jgi:hypothetical protein